MKSHFPILLIAAVTSAAALQKTGTAPPTPVFGASTRLVQVNVVALDKNGKPVTDLRKEDFALFEDGKPQKTAIFVPEQSAPVKPPVLAPNEFSNQLPGVSSNP